MEWSSLLLLGGIGFAAGTLGAMLGLGGGIFIVPLLTLLLQLPLHIAIGTSIVAIVVISSAATSSYIKSGMTHIRLGMLLELPTTIGAICGAIVATSLNPQPLSALFGLLLTYTGCSMLRQGRRGDELTSNATLPQTRGHYDNPGTLSLSTSYYDQNLGQTIPYQVTHIPQGLGASFFAGNIAGLLGVGGGIIKVPAMNLIMGVPIKVAMATSNFMIGITAVAGAFIYYYRGFVYPHLAAPIILGAFLGAQLGSRIAPRISGRQLNFVFAIALLITSVLMWLKAANIAFAY